MHCVICDKTLTDYEATRRHALTNEFLDTCNRCMKDMPSIPTKDRPDLLQGADHDDDNDDLDTLGNDLDLDTVTHCYNLAVDKERE